MFSEIKKPGEEISWDLENYEEFPTQFNEKGVDFPTLATTPTNSNSWGSSTFSKALQANKPPSQAVATVRSRISFESLARGECLTLIPDNYCRRLILIEKQSS